MKHGLFRNYLKGVRENALNGLFIGYSMRENIAGIMLDFFKQELYKLLYDIKIL